MRILHAGLGWVRLLTVAAGALSLYACASLVGVTDIVGADEGGTASGTFSGSAFVVNGVGAATASASNPVNPGYFQVTILLTSYADLCAIPVNSAIPSSQELELDIVSSSEISPGSYDVAFTSWGPNDEIFVDAGSGNFEAPDAFYFAQDQNCNTTVEEGATSGTITITEIDSSQITGSYDLTLAVYDPSTGATLAGADHVTGSFVAPICPSLSQEITEVEDAGTAVCN